MKQAAYFGFRFLAYLLLGFLVYWIWSRETA